MKQVLFALALWAPMVGWGQDTLSRAEGFSRKAGTLLEKSFETVGFVKGVEVQVYTIKDWMTDAVVKAVRIETEIAGQYTSTSRISVLDADEIDGLVKSVKIMQEKVFPGARNLYSEVRFKSRGGFEVGAFYDTKKKSWSAYLDFGKVGKSTVFLSVEELATFSFFLEESKKKM